MTQALRRLIDLPGIADMESRALMKPGHADPARRDEFPEVGALLTSVFGLTAEQAEDVARPADWDDIERLHPSDQVEAFAAEGWDVRDARGRPLRMLPVLAAPLALAMRGIAGRLPEAAFVPEPEVSDDWGASLASEAARFRKR